MATPTDGSPSRRTARRFRFDDRAGDGLTRTERRVSGRRVVLVGAVLSLVLVGVLTGVFRTWRARYDDRVAFGRSQVAPMVNPLGELDPPGIPSRAWSDAVADTRALLVEVARSGLLDWPGLYALRADLAARSARATTETAVVELGRIWVDLTAGAGPAVARAPRRDPLNFATTVDPLILTVPPDIARPEWREAVAETHALLFSLAASGRLDADQLQAQRESIAAVVSPATPATARQDLGVIWDQAADASGLRPPRPSCLPPPAPHSQQDDGDPRPLTAPLAQTPGPLPRFPGSNPRHLIG